MSNENRSGGEWATTGAEGNEQLLEGMRGAEENERDCTELGQKTNKMAGLRPAHHLTAIHTKVCEVHSAHFKGMAKGLSSTCAHISVPV